MTTEKTELRVRLSKKEKKEFLEKMNMLGYGTQGSFVMHCVRIAYDINYMSTETEIIPVALQKSIDATIKGNLKQFENRIASNTSNLAITQHMIMQLLEKEYAVSDIELKNLRFNAIEMMQQEKVKKRNRGD
jgi:predicted flavoprotein YhiN